MHDFEILCLLMIDLASLLCQVEKLVTHKDYGVF